MPTALSTTKRKFHKLLDSISNASSTSLTTHHDNSKASTTTLLAPSAKKARVERPLSAYVPRSAGMGPPSPNTTAAGSTRPKSVAVTQTKTTLSLSGEHKHPPNFAPWDRERFLERLKTYRFVDKWTAKPERVSEVEWAKRGWSCVGRERVGCVGGCGAEVVVKLQEEYAEREQDEKGEEDEGRDENEDDWREKAQEQLVERYAEMISTGHTEGCLWRRRGCDDTIQRLPLVHQANALDGLRARYQSLLAIASELPEEVSTPEDLDVLKTAQQATRLVQAPNDTGSTGTLAITEVNRSALFLALFGWQAEENHISGLATCNACFRRLGLWLFKSSDSSMERLDVSGEHRDHCPWINPLSQNGGNRRSSLDGLAGWEVLLRAVVARAGRELSRESDETRLGLERPLSAGSEGASFIDSVVEEDETAREERDKERWAKLKRLKQVFHVKKRPGTSGSSTTAGAASNAT